MRRAGARVSPCAAGGLARHVAVERVAELGAKGPERPLESVGDRALERRLMPLGGLVGDRLETHVGAGRSAGDGDLHRGGVGPDALDLAGLRVHLVQLPEQHVAHHLVAPAAEPEDAVGLVDGGAALDVAEAAVAPALALGDQAGVQGLGQLVGDAGGQGVPQEVVGGDGLGGLWWPWCPLPFLDTPLAGTWWLVLPFWWPFTLPLTWPLRCWPLLFAPLRWLPLPFSSDMTYLLEVVITRVVVRRPEKGSCRRGGRPRQEMGRVSPRGISWGAGEKAQARRGRRAGRGKGGGEGVD